jgi:hypothetical protein
MFSQLSLELLPSVISSPERASGALRFAAQASPIRSACGAVHPLASLSARQAQALGLLTSGTYGRHGFTSSNSHALQKSMASRLQARTDLLGSTLFGLTWKLRDTPSLRSIFALRAGERPTGGSGFTSWPMPRAADSMGGVEPEGATGRKLCTIADMAAWPTPTARENAGCPEKKEQRRQRNKVKWKNGNGFGLSTAEAASLSSWATPSATDYKGSVTLEATMKRQEESGRGVNLREEVVRFLAGWATPNTMDGLPQRSSEAMQRVYNTTRKGRTAPSNLREQVDPTQYPENFPPLTPARLMASGEMLTGSSAGMESGGQLDPDHSLWLQGYPLHLRNSIPGFADWQRWQDFLQAHSNAPDLIAPPPLDCTAMPSLKPAPEALSNAPKKRSRKSKTNPEGEKHA